MESLIPKDECLGSPYSHGETQFIQRTTRLPLLKKNKRITTGHGNLDAIGDKQGPASQSIDSLTKHLGFRTQCIDQLTNWHHLYESGAITKQQYYYEQLKGSWIVSYYVIV